jgi:hypothetical protein
LGFFLFAPEAVLEQPDHEHDQRSSNSNKAGNSETGASGSTDSFDAGINGLGADFLSEPEKSRCAPSRARALIFKRFHELQVTNVGWKLLLVGCWLLNRAIYAISKGFETLNAASSQNNGCGTIWWCSILGAALESEVRFRSISIAVGVGSCVTGALSSAHVLVVEVKHAGVNAADFLVLPCGSSRLGLAESLDGVRHWSGRGGKDDTDNENEQRRWAKRAAKSHNEEFGIALSD